MTRAMDKHRETVRKAALAPEAPGGQVAHISADNAVPDMKVRVLPGQHVKVPDGHPATPDDYYEGAELSMEGPSAHHLEELGFVEIIGEAS